MREDPDLLSADDARILQLESPTITGHTLKLIVLESGDMLDLGTLQATVAERLPSQPRATQRVDTSGSQPRWVDATDFDIGYHIRRRSTPGCDSRADLWRVVSRLMSEHAEELYDLFHALGRLKHLGTAVQRLARSAREFSVAISNVPGPSTPMSVAGRRVQHFFSSAEPADHHALRISAISCSADIGIGLCTDPLALSDVARLADAIESSFAELRRS